MVWRRPYRLGTSKSITVAGSYSPIGVALTCDAAAGDLRRAAASLLRRLGNGPGRAGGHSLRIVFDSAGARFKDARGR